MDYVKAFRPEELVELLVRAKGIDVVAINVRDQCTWTDHLIITTARSKQHLRALAGAVLHAVKARTEYVAGGQLQPVVEGKENGGDDENITVDNIDFELWLGDPSMPNPVPIQAKYWPFNASKEGVSSQAFWGKERVAAWCTCSLPMVARGTI